MTIAERTDTTKRVTWRTLVGILLVPLAVGGVLLWALDDPTDRLDQVTAAVVNEDEPVELDGQLVPLGRQLTAGLVGDGSEDSGNFTWAITDADDAEAGLASGEYAAVVTIPSDFSANATSLSDAEAATQATIDVRTSDENRLLDDALTQAVTTTAADVVGTELGTTYLDNVYVGFNTLSESIGQAADGAAELGTGAEGVATGSTELAAGLDELVVGAQGAASGADELAAGADGAASGASALAGGLDQLAAGTAALPDQSAQLASGAEGVAAGASGVATGTAGVSQGVDDLADGLQQLAAACRLAALPAYCDQVQATADSVATQLAPAAAQTAAGAEQVADGAAGVATGTRALADGTPALADGVAQSAAGADALASGVGELATGADGLAAGVGQLADGTAQSAAGADQLADGAGQLASGTTELADGLATAADQVPTYTESERTNLADVVLDPVTTGDADETSLFSASAVPLLAGVAMWIGAIAAFTVLRAVPRDVLGSRRSSLALALRALAPAAVLGAVEGVIVAGIAQIVLDLDVGAWFGFAGVLALSGVAFAAVLQALVALFGGAGRLVATVAGVLALATGIVSTAPAILRDAAGLLPTEHAFQAMLGVVTGSGGAGVAALVLWAVLAFAATVAATSRRRSVTVGTLPVLAR